MARAIIIIGLVIVVLLSCGKVREARKVAKTVRNAASSMQEAGKVMGKDFDEETLKKVKLEEKDVEKFYTEIGKLKKKHPDIEFRVLQQAAVMAGAKGKKLQDIIEEDSDLSYEEFAKLSMVILMAETQGAMLKMGKQMTRAMKKGSGALNNPNVRMTEEEKKELTQQIAKTEKELKAQEAESGTIKENYELITKVKARLEE